MATQASPTVAPASTIPASLARASTLFSVESGTESLVPAVVDSRDTSVAAESRLPTDVGGMWESIRATLRAECGARTFDNWLRPIEFIAVQGDTVRLALPTHFLADWISSHYLERLRVLWATHCPQVGHVVLSVQPAMRQAAAAQMSPTPQPA